MLPRFEQFIRERQYLTNVTPATVEWYRCSLKWLPSESPSQIVARRTDPKYLRGSDLSERLYVSVEALKQAGCTQKEALFTVAELAQKYLGQSKRGRPRLGTAKQGFLPTAESVRSMVNAFAKRMRSHDDLVGRRVGVFLWSQRAGATLGSEFVPDGNKIRSRWVDAIRRLRGLQHFDGRRA